MVEMLFILVMLGVAGLMSARLFTASMRVIGSAPLAQDRSARVDRMSGILRKDVWNASKINCAPDAVMLIPGKRQDATGFVVSHRAEVTDRIERELRNYLPLHVQTSLLPSLATSACK